MAISLNMLGVTKIRVLNLVPAMLLSLIHILKPTGVAVINDYAIKSTTIASGQEAYPQGLSLIHI